LKSNIDYIFLFGEDFISNKRKLFEYYAGIFSTFESFDQVFSKLTSNFGCMVIDNKTITDDINEKIFWYKSEKHNNYKLLEN
jgi:hypothetical protein